MREAQRSEVLIYSIALPRWMKYCCARNNAKTRGLKELAEASGGVDFYPKTLAEVEQITPRVAHEIRTSTRLRTRP